MYQKKPAKKNSAVRKSSTSRKYTGTKRKTSSNKRVLTTKKTKVSFSAYKVIMLCAGIIAVCMVLLLVSNFSQRPDNNEEKPQIVKKYEPSVPSESADIPEVTIKKTVEPPKNTVEPEDKKDSAKTDNSASKNTTKNSTETKKATESSKQTPKTPVASSTSVKPPASSATTQKPASNAQQKPASTPAKTDYNFPLSTNHAQLVFVFDDGGQNMQQLEKFVNLPFPITVAVLPQLAHSAEAAERVRKSGNEVILHQPMQAVNSKVNPGPGAITPDMNEAQVISQLFININQLGPIAGMNNHEGSAITADADMMAVILQTASENGIYFLDSRTNVETKVPYVASELGYSYYERNIFLDNTKTKDNVITELKKGLAIANKNGTVIMIGHVWSADFLPALLAEVYPELKTKGYTFTTVSKSNAIKY